MGNEWGRRTVLVGLGVAVLAGCGRRGGDEILVAEPAKDRWPDLYRQAEPEVQAAYRYAVGSGREVLRWMPCYCGCEEVGHTSNLDCFVDEFRSDGSVVLDTMSFG